MSDWLLVAGMQRRMAVLCGSCAVLTIHKRHVLRLFGCHQLEECTVDLVYVAQIALQVRTKLQTLSTDTQHRQAHSVSGW